MFVEQAEGYVKALEKSTSPLSAAAEKEVPDGAIAEEGLDAKNNHGRDPACQSHARGRGNARGIPRILDKTPLAVQLEKADG